MTKRTGLVLFIGAVLLVAVAYVSAFLPGGSPAWAPWLLAGGTCLSLVAMMVVGAARHGRIGGRLALAFGVVLAITAGGFATLLALPAADAADPALILGLPVRAAVLLYGIGIIPFFIVPLAYAWTFDEMTLSKADLERVRAAAPAGGAHGSSGPGGASEASSPNAASKGAAIAEAGR